MNNKDKVINNKFIDDLTQMYKDIDLGENYDTILQKLNKALISVEGEKAIHQGDRKMLDELAHFETALLSVKVKLLEHLIAYSY